MNQYISNLVKDCEATFIYKYMSRIPKTQLNIDSILVILGSFFFEEICRICTRVVDTNVKIDKSTDTTTNTISSSPFLTVCQSCLLDIINHRAEITEGETMNILDSKLRIFYYSKYSDSFKKLIRKFKYDDDLLIGHDLALLLYDKYKAVSKIQSTFKFSAASEIEILPVPLHKKRKKHRGFNQAEVIANEFNKLLRAKVNTRLLERCINTKPQFDLKKADRLANVKGAFRLKRAVRKDTNYILIDDLFTTGATITECATPIVKETEKDLIALTVARA